MDAIAMRDTCPGSQGLQPFAPPPFPGSRPVPAHDIEALRLRPLPELKFVEIAGFTDTIGKVHCPYCRHLMFFARLERGSCVEIKCRRCRRIVSMSS